MSDSEILQRIAAKAIITNKNGEVLIVREASTYNDGTHVGRYQFPGGRVNPGENFMDGLKREAKEETGLDIKFVKPLYVGEWHPVIKGQKNQIIAIFCICEALNDKVKLSEEHDAYAWVDPKGHAKYDLVDPEPEVMKVLISLKLAF